MGFYNLIPASKLSAQYSITEKKLILTAEGVVREATTGIEFKQAQFFGGLKFELGGWTGPLTGKSSPYKHTQVFQISLPSPVYPANEVIIADANHPNGIPVPIEYVGVDASVNANAVAGGMPTHPVANHKQITSTFGTPFEIRQAIPTTTGGSVSVQYDKTALNLVTSFHDNGEMVWVFDAVHLGETQVIVNVSGGIAQYVQKIVYDVHIIAVLAAGGAPNTQATLSFLGAVNIAIRKVRAEYPNAQLLEVDGYAMGGPTTNSQGIDKMRVVFQIGDMHSATVTSTAWGEFGPIEMHGVFAGDRVLPWPIKMTLVEANDLLKKAGFDGPYTGVTLRWPLYPGVTQPSYIFTTVNSGFVFVGVFDGKVHREDSTMEKTTKKGGKKSKSTTTA